MSTLASIYPQTEGTKQPRQVVRTLLGLLITAVFLFPFYMILESSLMAQTDVLRYPPPFVPPQLTLQGYTNALTTSAGFIFSSLNYGLGTVVVTMLIATPAAYSLARIRSRIGLFLLIALILAQMAPGFVVANSLYALFSRLHIINTTIAVILADSTNAVPFAIIIMRAFMLNIPGELSEAA
ncbi:MAG TPA: hypothetical protein VKQ72_16350, partial [Aggregatilineales bacterium]|nr:hypothetical protein [Aggregatilineales bacterium]